MAKKIKIVIGSVRSNRAGKAVADWVMETAATRKTGYQYELVDLKEVNLPFFDEPAPPMAGAPPVHESTRKWAGIVNDGDAFVFITPEYNHGYSPALKNAIDHLFAEWKDKPAALVGYGGSGAPHSIRQLREILEFVGMNPLEAQVGVNGIWEAFDEDGNLKEDKISGDLPGLLGELEEVLERNPVGTSA